MQIFLGKQPFSIDAGSNIRTFAFQTGQIFSGAIQKLFPNDTALVQAGGRTFAAKLEVPLEAGKNYWFQTVLADGEVRLKMLSEADANGNAGKALLPQMQLPPGKTFQSLVSYLAEQGIPFTKSDIAAIGAWLKHVPDLAHGLETAAFMLQEGFPVSEGVFTSLLAAGQNIPAEQLLNRLQQALKQGEQTPETRQLLALIRELGAGSGQVTGEALRLQIKEKIQKMGLFYEAGLLHEDKAADKDGLPLKALLVDLLQKGGGTKAARDAADEIVQKLNGQQLLALPGGVVQHIWMEIPLSFAHFQTNAVVQWSGRRKNGGKIDSNYCKIIFYLNLQFMKETLVEMNVQNRIVSIRVSSLKKGLQEAVTPFLPALKEGLSKSGYTLSDVRFGEFQPGAVRAALSRSDVSGKGVDLRI
ncbi:hypothetical protein P9232_06375 [Weizmannia sp. CD-2023]|uniref:hypothetical protein n=1 Tax=Heyndrickxia TaxID=2837504 RepID=UPI002E201A29|nr:hypothetical protein [Weizmannia sp. CD-2023]